MAASRRALSTVSIARWVRLVAVLLIGVALALLVPVLTDEAPDYLLLLSLEAGRLPGQLDDSIYRSGLVIQHVHFHRARQVALDQLEWKALLSVLIAVVHSGSSHGYPASGTSAASSRLSSRRSS